MSEVKRRRFLNEPGEGLLLNSDPVEFVRRFDEFVDESGLPPERVLALPLISVPLPVATVGEDGRPNRWSGANPAFMWHPLMWLPAHIALRYRYRVIDDAQGGTDIDYEIESDSLWATRVALELVHSGLYNPEDGTWLDVLAYAGLDIENPVDQARVELWLNGSHDDTLDAIDLEPLVLVPEDSEWALRAANDLVDTLVPAQWSLIASGIIEAVDSYVAQNGATDAALLSALNTMGQVAALALQGVPADPETGFSYVDVLSMLTAEALERGADVAALMESFLDALGEIAVDYRPSLQAMEADGPLAVAS
ncbi:MAG: hypothetical protein CMH36_08780 [Microbacterium sp.]|uniref:Uncharacterized protein n=1 Tax=Microbacterium ginsengisoli TaxID=400772 RepID=A0A3C1K8R0_9MICO|nr:hypothetical protein [uncultured Microbacterium sp.]MAL06905.1 hypothetical protein [Microbacterium sp.]HAN23022.1 hypothetical protein [Microbacterium ginsengisoli]